MARTILIYGQPGSGKSFSLRNLDPASTVIIDADKKGGLTWRGYKKDYSADKKNFFKVNSLEKIIATVRNIGAKDDCNYIKTLIIDGFNNAMTNEILFYDEVNGTTNKFEKYEMLAKRVVKLIDTAQSLRDDLTVVFTAHVETADPYVATDVDKVFTPGKMIKEKIKLESKFLYVFYSKVEEGEFFFETAPNKSTARSPHECFNAKIPNDVAAAIETIKNYEEGN